MSRWRHREHTSAGTKTQMAALDATTPAEIEAVRGALSCGALLRET